MRRLFALLLVAFAAPAASALPLVLSYSVPAAGGVFESFDSMGAAGTRAPGQANGAAWDSYWSLQLAGATPVEQYASLGLPSASPPIDAYNGGSAGALDRAMGLYTTATGNPSRQMSARFANATGASLSVFHVEFDVEFWLQRNARWGGLQAFYSPDGATWTDLGNAFEGTMLTPSTGFVDGNLPANSMRGVGGQVDLASYGLAPIPAGGTFFLRFSGSLGLTTPPGHALNQNRQVGAFLDNLWVGTTARPPVVPEAQTAAMLALGLVGLAWRGRPRSAARG
jgi:hypothetical protein